MPVWPLWVSAALMLLLNKMMAAVRIAANVMTAVRIAAKSAIATVIATVTVTAIVGEEGAMTVLFFEFTKRQF